MLGRDPTRRHAFRVFAVCAVGAGGGNVFGHVGLE